jgi:hypothetical protein
MSYTAEESTAIEREREFVAPSRLLASREIAVRHIFRGGVTSLAGFTALAGGVFTTYGLSWALGLGGLAIGGAGLIELGRAALHMRRYGSDRGALILGGAVGLGVSLLSWGATALPAALGIFPFLARFNLAALCAVLGFGVFMVLLTLGGVVRWILHSDENMSENGGE